MAQRGRKSAASLSVMPLAPRPYPAAPKELTPTQATTWDEIVRCRPPEFFDGACRFLLMAYCRHADSADVIARAVQKTDPENLRLYSKLLEMGARESKAIMSLSSKLRLAPSNTKRIEQVRPDPNYLRPWEKFT